jgi:hypothetical protein
MVMNALINSSNVFVVLLDYIIAAAHTSVWGVALDQEQMARGFHCHCSESPAINRFYPTIAKS